MLSWNFLTDTINENALLLDCRSEKQYDEATIRGARGAAFIKKPYGSGPQSLVKLAGYLQRLLEMAEGREIIVFDEGEGMYASRMMWLLFAAGYSSVRMYSSRFETISPDLLEKGTAQIEAPPAKGPLNLKGIVGITQVQQNLTRVQLLDVRTPEEYDGIIPRMSNFEPGSVCGRIPGSVNWDWRILYDTEGALKGKSDVIMDIRRIGLIPERPTVIYDFNGARACTTALVMSRCGYRQVSVYLGSWMEWRKSKLPKQNVNVWMSESVV